MRGLINDEKFKHLESGSSRSPCSEIRLSRQIFIFIFEKNKAFLKKVRLKISFKKRCIETPVSSPIIL